MIFTSKPKKIRVMFTPFRDGLQSSFGGRVRCKDILPAMAAAAEAGIRHLEFGGGARYQAPFFYVGEDPFECMDEMREAVGQDVDLQILTRSVSGVTLTTQNLKALTLQAKLMKKHGTTWDRNFDFMNDVENLAKTGQPIVDAGMHHQVCVALMGLPFKSDKAHTAASYVDVIKRFVDQGVPFDSICMKDASGTTDPKTCYDTARGLRKLLGPDVLLWQHTHDTAAMALACYLAGIEGGVDGIDLSIRPLASGTMQPDVRSMWQALKGTGFSLDVDHEKMHDIENMLCECMKDYEFDPVATTADARVLRFPMPGSAIGPNVGLMKEAGILERYHDVLAEFPVVVKAGGAWTSVTPGSQHYWQQAVNNVRYGRWKRTDAGFGRSVLGYFGKTPLPSDPEVVKIAKKQLALDHCMGDPLEAAPDSLSQAAKALEKRGLDTTEENLFLVASAIVPGKKMDHNEGLRLLKGQAKIVLRLKKQEPKLASKAAEPAREGAMPMAMQLPQGQVTTTCEVVEGETKRRFKVTLELPGDVAVPVGNVEAQPVGGAETQPAAASAARGGEGDGDGTPVFPPCDGKAELVDIRVSVGDAVSEGDVVAVVEAMTPEAMKEKHDVRAPCSGIVAAIDAGLGDDIMAGRAIMTIGG